MRFSGRSDACSGRAASVVCIDSTKRWISDEINHLTGMCAFKTEIDDAVDDQ
jgi:hypothetical protein